jgi:hypothetical protein
MKHLNPTAVQFLRSHNVIQCTCHCNKEDFYANLVEVHYYLQGEVYKR